MPMAQNMRIEDDPSEIMSGIPQSLDPEDPMAAFASMLEKDLEGFEDDSFDDDDDFDDSDDNF